MTTSGKSLAIGLTTTIADAEESIDAFLTYHFALGFAHIFLFIDDNCVATLQKAKSYPNVTCFFRDPALREAWSHTPPHSDPRKQHLIDTEVMVRQEMNFFLGFNEAAVRHLDWLLHIDGDELFYPNGASLQDHFKALQKDGVTCITYLNYESISTKEDSKNIFLSSPYFKINFFRHKHWVFSREQREFLKNTPWTKEKYFNYYQNGKSAVKIGKGNLSVYDVHSIIIEGKRKFGRVDDPVILHFPCARMSDFVKKYHRLGNFSDKWMEFDRAGEFIERVHLQARDVFLQQRQDEIENFYRNHFILTDEQVQQLIDRGLATKIDLHLQLLEAHLR